MSLRFLCFDFLLSLWTILNPFESVCVHAWHKPYVATQCEIRIHCARIIKIALKLSKLHLNFVYLTVLWLLWAPNYHVYPVQKKVYSNQKSQKNLKKFFVTNVRLLVSL